MNRLVTPFAILAAALVLIYTPAAASAANFTWTGTAALDPHEDSWSDAANWGGTVPAGSVGRLTFPTLHEPPCSSNPARLITCYQGKNDINGLAVDAISIDDGVSYLLSGDPIRLGKGGVAASPSASDPQRATPPQLELPIVLTAPQTWSIVGGPHGQQLGVQGNVSGESESLGIHLSDSAFLSVNSEVEVGRVSIGGAGRFAGGVALGALPGSKRPASLNGADRRPVDVKGSSLFVTRPGSMVGPLTVSGGNLQVGQSSPPNGSLTVAGPLTLHSQASLSLYINSRGTTPGTDFSQLRVAGKVSLHDAHLRLGGGSSRRGGRSCTGLRAGTAYPLIKAGGGLSGKFHGIHDGATIPLQYCSGSAAPDIRIDYRRHAVVATVQR